MRIFDGCAKFLPQVKRSVIIIKKLIYMSFLKVAERLKGELHSNSWNLTFVNKLQFPQFYDRLSLKHQKLIIARSFLGK